MGIRNYVLFGLLAALCCCMCRASATTRGRVGNGALKTHASARTAVRWYTQHRRRLLTPTTGCACVCGGVHQGYVTAWGNNQCTASLCVNGFPSCSYGDAVVYFNGGTLSDGETSGTMTLQSASPTACYQGILNYDCAQQYKYSVNKGFIEFVSTSSSACAPGSAQESIIYPSRDTVAAGHFVGNVNLTAFTLKGKGDSLQMNINQGCILQYKVSSGEKLLQSGSSKCFPGNAVVQTPKGLLAMSSLQVGDKVLTARSDGTALYEPVFMFSHQHADLLSEFVILSTQSGQRLAASPGHYIRVTRALEADPSASLSLRGLPSRSLSEAGLPIFKEAKILRAEDVAVGDWVWVAQGKEAGSLAPSRVVATAVELGEGLYNPHTMSGTIVVNGVLALTFTDTLLPLPWLHTFITAPAALVAALSPSHRATAALNRAILSWLGV